MTQYSGSMMGDSLSYADELTPQRVEKIQQLRRRLGWRRGLSRLVSMGALPAMLSVALIIVELVPLPSKAASLGSGLTVKVCSSAACPVASPMTLQMFAGSRITFNGRLTATARRTSVTVVLQKTGHAGAGTIGTIWTRASHVFNAQAIPLPTLFAQMGVTPQQATTYRIAVETGGATLTSAAIALEH
jgi:hypothetical protein